MGSWEKYIEKIQDINIQLPVLFASLLAVYLQKKSIIDFGPFSYLLSFLAVFSFVAVLFIFFKKGFLGFKAFKDNIRNKSVEYLKNKSFEKKLGKNLEGFDIFELYILDLFRKENVIIINGHRTRNLETNDFVKVIGKNKFKRKLVLTKRAEVFLKYPKETFDGVCVKSCLRFLSGLDEDELIVIDELYNSENGRLNKYFRDPRSRQLVGYEYTSFLIGLEDSVFLKRTVSNRSFVISDYGVRAYEMLVKQ